MTFSSVLQVSKLWAASCRCVFPVHISYAIYMLHWFNYAIKCNCNLIVIWNFFRSESFSELECTTPWCIEYCNLNVLWLSKASLSKCTCGSNRMLCYKTRIQIQIYKCILCKSHGIVMMCNVYLGFGTIRRILTFFSGLIQISMFHFKTFGKYMMCNWMCIWLSRNEGVIFIIEYAMFDAFLSLHELVLGFC